MTFIRRFGHVGVTVADLDAATAFFVSLGLEADRKMAVEGEFLDTVIGMTYARTEIVMLRPPGGGTTLELSSFTRPDHLPGSPVAPANELGLRNVAFEGMWQMAYVRGPKESSSRWPSASRSEEKS